MAAMDEKIPQNPGNQQLDLSQALAQVLGSVGSTVPMTTTGTTPPSYIPPVPRQSAPFTSAGGGEYRSRGAANFAAASNLFGNVAQAINTARENQDAQKARKLAIDVERIYTAQAGIEQAKQNPNDPNSKATIEKNTQIINDMLSDPKRRKDLEQAFDFSFIGDDKNKNSWQRKAGQMGAQSYQAQLERQMPTTTQINPVAVQQQKSATEQMKAMSPMISAMIRSMGEQNIQQQKSQIAMASIKERADDAWMRYSASEDRTQAYTAAQQQHYKVMWARNALLGKQLQEKAGDNAVKNVLNSTKIESDALNKQISNITARLNQFTRSAELSKLSPQEKAEYDMLSKQLDGLRLKQLDLQAKTDAINQVLSGGKPKGAITTTTVGGPSGGSSNSNGAISGSGQSDEDERFDEELLDEASTDE